MVNVLMRQLRGLPGHSLLLAGLLFLPACTAPGGTSQRSDHVFSTAAPHDLDMQADGHPLPVKASYPVAGDSVSVDRSRNTTLRSSITRQELAGMLADVPQPKSSVGIARASSSSEQSADGRSASSIRTATWSSDDTKNEFQLVSWSPDEKCEIPPANGPRFYPAEPRIATPAGRDAPLNAMETVAVSAFADYFPDEYVYDGGDRDLPVHYSGTSRRGFDTEDTVVEYRDQKGEFQVKPSNRVAVYAPRFGSVRAITGLEADVKYDGAAGARDTLVAGNLNSGDAASQNVQGVNPLQLMDQRRLDGFETSLPPSQSAVADHPEQSRKVDQGLQGRNVTSVNVFDRRDAPILAAMLQNAIAWTRDEYPVITASTSSASDIIAKFRLQQTIGIEDGRKTDGQIRIVKLADTAIAQSGDTVVFTIQFENVGDFPVYDVQIVDNLTPRLEYVPGTATIDDAHPGEVVVEPNGEGSHTLTFVLDERLEGHARGTIRFETRVR
jgi:uncharacterized repeat protein (TIGR01451 family)